MDSEGYAPGQKLTFTTNSWYFIQATGLAVVNGDEIDFFKSPGCIDELGYDAVGRYRWSLTGKTLSFSALNSDPCERKSIFDGVSFTEVPRQ